MVLITDREFKFSRPNCAVRKRIVVKSEIRIDDATKDLSDVTEINIDYEEATPSCNGMSMRIQIKPDGCGVGWHGFRAIYETPGDWITALETIHDMDKRIVNDKLVADKGYNLCIEHKSITAMMEPIRRKVPEENINPVIGEILMLFHIIQLRVGGEMIERSQVITRIS